MSGIPSRRNSAYGSSSSGYSSASRTTPKTAQSIRRSQSMRYAQRHNSNLSNNSNGSVTPLSRSRRVASIPSNIANANDKPLDGENDYKNEYKNDYNNKNSNKTNGKSENLFNFIIAKDLEHFKNEKVFRVLVVGTQDSGKSSLISQFSYYLEDQKRQYNTKKQSQYLILNFREIERLDNCFPRSPIALYMPDAYIVVYAVNDRESYEGAKKVIHEIHKWDDIELKALILVANKTDLVRSRTVTKQEGRQLAIANNCKYIETSCAISHNIDFLLTGIGAQINLKNNSNSKSGQTNSSRKPNLFKRLLRKAAINKSKSCDNLHVL